MRGRCGAIALSLGLACDAGSPASGPTKVTDPAPVAAAKVTDPAPVAAAKVADPVAAAPVAADADRETDPAAPHFSRSTLETTVSGEGEGPYRFTASWHTRRAANWARLLEPYRGRAGLNYLEIGVFEGRSLLWMFDHVLTEASSRATVVDPFFEDGDDAYETNYDHNVAASGQGDRVTKIKALSEVGLRGLPSSSFDIIYVDGSHTADDVLLDAVLSWDLLRDGGVIIFDDYHWGGRPKGDPIPAELRPEVAVDAFITAHRYEVEILDKGAQVWLKKHANPCPVKDYCTPYGEHLYFWREFALRDADGNTIALTPEETRMVERLLGSARFGEVKIRVNREQRDDPTYQSLRAKLEH